MPLLKLFLLEQCVHKLLFLLHKLLSFFETVALAFDVDDGAVMQHAIKNGRGDGHIGEHFIPLGEGLVAGKDSGDLLIPSGNELEEQIGSLNIHRQIANFVNDKQLVFT